MCHWLLIIRTRIRFLCDTIYRYAISNSPEDKVGVASGIYKMASSLGGAFGIALSGTLYGIGAAMVNINFGAMLGLWLNILMAIISFTVILIGVPKQQSK